MSVPDEGYCPTCRTRSLLTRRGWCVWCDTPVAEPPRRVPPARERKMGEDVIEDALALYETGRSLRSVARELMPRTAYTDHRVMAQCLARFFRMRGVPVRSPREQSVLQGLKHARLARECPEAATKRLERIVAGLPERDRCMGTTKAGRRCRLPAEFRSEFCWTHNPANAEAVALRDARLCAAREAYHGSLL